MKKATCGMKLRRTSGTLTHPCALIVSRILRSLHKRARCAQWARHFSFTGYCAWSEEFKKRHILARKLLRGSLNASLHVEAAWGSPRWRDFSLERGDLENALGFGRSAHLIRFILRTSERVPDCRR